VNFHNKIIFYGEELLAPRPNPKAGGPPIVGCPRLFIQYIRSYPPYLEPVSSIRNLRTRHAVVTRDPPNMSSLCTKYRILTFRFEILTAVSMKITVLWDLTPYIPVEISPHVPHDVTLRKITNSKCTNPNQRSSMYGLLGRT
jgi:hypothetical protein